MIITIDCGCAAASTVQTILVDAGPIDDLPGCEPPAPRPISTAPLLPRALRPQVRDRRDPRLLRQRVSALASRGVTHR